ncbi:gnat family protein [Cystoisospora suis]|uniref:Gnat family protein n=1 Tax=Cystoisospora suis TaxID=483139 RepID=A0A2C6KNR5_9APIC|nr:gnat family protein [Cystoisospora suis]
MLLVPEEVKAVGGCGCFPENKQTFPCDEEVAQQTTSETLVSVLLLSAVSTLRGENRPGDVAVEAGDSRPGCQLKNEGEVVHGNQDGEIRRRLGGKREERQEDQAMKKGALRSREDLKEKEHHYDGEELFDKQGKVEIQVGPQRGTSCADLDERRDAHDSDGAVALSVKTDAGASAAVRGPTQVVKSRDMTEGTKKDSLETPVETFPDCRDICVIDDLVSRLGEPGMDALLAACDELSVRVFDQKCLEVTSKKKKWVLSVLTDSSRSVGPAPPCVSRTSGVQTHCTAGTGVRTVACPTPSLSEKEKVSFPCSTDSGALNKKGEAEVHPSEKCYAAMPLCDRAVERLGDCPEEINAEGQGKTEQVTRKDEEDDQMQLDEGREQLSAPRCLGFIVYRIDYELQSMQIGKVAVLEACRGRGYGKKLVRGLIRTARQNKALAYVSLSALTSAVSFYTPLGFKRCDEIAVDADEENAPQVYMEMQLRRRTGPVSSQVKKKNGRRKK